MGDATVRPGTLLEKGLPAKRAAGDGAARHEASNPAHGHSLGLETDGDEESITRSGDSQGYKELTR